MDGSVTVTVASPRGSRPSCRHGHRALGSPGGVVLYRCELAAAATTTVTCYMSVTARSSRAPCEEC